MSDLDMRLNSALDRHDSAALVALYEEAASHARDPRKQAFFLTHAWIHALECGHAQTSELRQRLTAMGCERD